MDVQVVVLAGGRGQYLYPLADSHTPKMLLPVANKAMIVHLLEMIEQTALVFTKKLIIATPERYYYKLDKYLARRLCGVFQNEFEVLAVPAGFYGTVGTLEYLKNRIFCDVVVLSVDTLMDPGVFTQFIEQSLLLESDCCMLMYRGVASDHELEIFGVSGDRVALMYNACDNEDGFVLSKKTLEKFPRLEIKNDMISAYCYYFKNKVVKTCFQNELPDWGRTDSIKEDVVHYLIEKQHSAVLLQQLNTALPAQDSVTVTYVLADAGFCRRVNNLKNYLEVNMKALISVTGLGKNKQPAKPPPLCLRPTLNSPENIVEELHKASPSLAKQVSADSNIRANFLLEEKSSVNKSIIGKNVRIGKHCKVLGCVIFDNVTIEDGCNLNNSIVCSKAKIGRNSKVLNSQLAYNCEVQPESFLKEDKII